MKLFKSLALGTAVFAFTAMATAQDTPRSVERILNISNVFVSGKMDKDDASVVLTGQFPNSCYSWSRATMNEKSDDLAPNTHVIRAYANVVQGMCLMVLTPFTKEVDMGPLSDGEHKIKVINGDGTFQQLIIDVK